MYDFEEAPNDGPARVGVHSLEGFGKTFLASFFPNTVWIAPENGFPRDLPIRPMVIKNIRDWPDVLGAIDKLTNTNHDRETLVVDTMDWLEPLIWRYVCERDSGRQTEMNKSGNKLISIEDYGHGKGYMVAEDEIRRMISLLDEMQHRKKMHVVLLMHSTIAKFENPSGANYNRYEPRMQKRASAVCKQWVENLLYGFYEVHAAKLDEKEKTAKGVSTGKRLLGTRNNSAYDAKNRVQLPDVVELTDPGIIVPYLLGRVEVQSPYKLVDHTAAATTKTSKTKKADAKKEPETDGKVAHHPDRQADEEKRKNDALDKVRDTPKSADDAKTEARTWTEPNDGKKKSEPKADPKSSLPPAQEKLMADLANVLTRASKEIGDAYRAKVEKWVKLANKDPEKLDAIVEDVLLTLENNKNSAA